MTTIAAMTSGAAHCAAPLVHPAHERALPYDSLTDVSIRNSLAIASQNARVTVTYLHATFM